MIADHDMAGASPARSAAWNRSVCPSLVRPAAALALLLVAAGCEVAGHVEPRTDSDATPQATAASVSESGAGALERAASLRQEGRIAQALAILEAAALREPGDPAILSAYGKLLVEAGQPEQAAEVLARAHSPGNPDWRILSAQGVAADQTGRHAQARTLYEAALRLNPDEPGVLTNLGLSYALDRQLARAEATLRRAAEQPGAGAATRQALALVLALSGKREQAAHVAARDLSPAEASRSLAVLGRLAPGR
jgi:Flp pilus assembly protein TadD